MRYVLILAGGRSLLEESYARLVCPKADELKKLYAVAAGKEGGKYR
jgi:hypothetical protein